MHYHTLFDPRVHGVCVCVFCVLPTCRWLGVSKFYIYDNNSTLPAMLMLWDYMRAGIVEYEYFLGECALHRPVGWMQRHGDHTGQLGDAAVSKLRASWPQQALKVPTAAVAGF